MASCWIINQLPTERRVAWGWLPPDTSTCRILQVIPPGKSKISPNNTHLHQGCTHLTASKLIFSQTLSGTHLGPTGRPNIGPQNSEKKCSRFSRYSSYIMPTMQMFEDIPMSKWPHFSSFNWVFFSGGLGEQCILKTLLHWSFFCPGHLLLIPSLHSSFHPHPQSINLNVSIIAGIITFGFSI